MKIYLAFSGEGSTDRQFFPMITERLIEEYYLGKGISVELSWSFYKKVGSSFDSIIDVCEKTKDQNLVIIHRDSDNATWNVAYANHFEEAKQHMMNINNDQFNENLLPLIPVTETEAWLLVDKRLLKSSIGTDLSDQDLGLTYKQSRIESIADPKRTIENAIKTYHYSLSKKQRKYAVQIYDLYDILASDMNLSQLEALDSYQRFKSSLIDILDNIGVN